MDNNVSDAAVLKPGVPQGSVLRPLFIIYVLPLDSIIHRPGITFQSKLSISSPSSLSVCIHELQSWLHSSLLMLNPQRSEHPYICTKTSLTSLTNAQIIIGNTLVIPSSRTCNLRGFSDPLLSFEPPVQSLSKAALFTFAI